MIMAARSAGHALDELTPKSLVACLCNIRCQQRRWWSQWLAVCQLFISSRMQLTFALPAFLFSFFFSFFVASEPLDVALVLCNYYSRCFYLL